MNYVAMAKKELKNLQQFCKGKTFQDIIFLFKESNINFRVINDEYIDVDQRTTTITIKNDNGKALVLTSGIEVYDKDGMMFGIYHF